MLLPDSGTCRKRRPTTRTATASRGTSRRCRSTPRPMRDARSSTSRPVEFGADVRARARHRATLLAAPATSSARPACELRRLTARGSLFSRRPRPRRRRADAAAGRAAAQPTAWWSSRPTATGCTRRSTPAEELAATHPPHGGARRHGAGAGVRGRPRADAAAPDRAAARRSRRIPDLPVYLNSPMAIDVTRLYRAASAASTGSTHAQCARDVRRGARCVNTVEESKRAERRCAVRSVIVSASGMATGGRVVHHLKAFAPRPAQHHPARRLPGGRHARRGARGRRGGGQDPRRLCAGARRGRAARALSAHADRDGAAGVAGRAAGGAARVFVTHGEPVAADALRSTCTRRSIGTRSVQPTAKRSRCASDASNKAHPRRTHCRDTAGARVRDLPA